MESSKKVPVAAAAASPSLPSSSPSPSTINTTPAGTNATTQTEALCRSILKLYKDDQIEEGAAVGCLLSLTRTLYLGTGGVGTTTMERTSREEKSTVETATTKKRKSDDGDCGGSSGGGSSAATRRCRRDGDGDDDHNGGNETRYSGTENGTLPRVLDIGNGTWDSVQHIRHYGGGSAAIHCRRQVDRSESDEDQSTLSFFTLSEKDIWKNLVGTIVTRDWHVEDDLVPFTGRVESGPTKLKKDKPSTWRVVYPDGDTEDIGYDDLVKTIKMNFMAYWEPNYGNNYDTWPALSGLLDLYADGQNSEPLTKGQRVIITEHFKQLQSMKHPLSQPNNGDDEEELPLDQVPESDTLNDKDIQEISEGCASVESQQAMDQH
eukprot:CAMPEP_0113451908 /NCGR_PEP_ID=MMETSP0014_2-20120614/6576_1 /TAXON_ID=2857 /ORGANISM="Nitzschia sp." /LENGTH=376 /DNA_ID=CAMNT_0000343269 /DNA_START=223 /DNA_END=1353 /DNA_ORIENTATION=+ /assembly_acc=CAM_ASM_000159